MTALAKIKKASQSQKDAEDSDNKQADPRSGENLLPMLVTGVVR